MIHVSRASTHGTTTVMTRATTEVSMSPQVMKTS